MAKISYLLGAGASFGIRDISQPYIDYKHSSRYKEINGRAPNIIEGLPIVSELPDRMSYIYYSIQKYIDHYNISNHPNGYIYENLAENLNWLKEASASHATVDTFAKKLWLTKKIEDFDKLKRTLSAYFMLEQLMLKPDKRYDAFFASVLGNNPEDLPKDVCILSWNYDCLLERAYAGYVSNIGLLAIEKKLHLLNKSIDVKDYDYNDSHSFKVFKLNGSALIYDTTNDEPFDFIFKRQGMSDISYIATISAPASNAKCALSFAWENMNTWYTEQLRKSIEDTEILVIIGYSFPYFNRKIDQFIFECATKIRKIYVQDPQSDQIAESVKNLLTPNHQHINKTTIINQRNTNQFLLPPEL